MALPDDLWEMATRFRLDMRAAASAVVPATPGVCCHTTRAGVWCGKPLDTQSAHAVHCGTGGGTQERHDALGKTLGAMVQDVLMTMCSYEQRAPQLDRMVNSTEEKTIMDVVYQDPDLGTQLIDVSVVSARAGTASRIMTAARRGGHAAERARTTKRTRYGEGATTFVLELGGRPSGPAKQWARALVPHAGEESEVPLLGAQAWCRVSCTLQLRRAAGL